MWVVDRFPQYNLYRAYADLAAHVLIACDLAQQCVRHALALRHDLQRNADVHGIIAGGTLRFRRFLDCTGTPFGTILLNEVFFVFSAVFSGWRRR